MTDTACPLCTHRPCPAWCECNCAVAVADAEIATLRTRVAELERLAYLGDHHFPNQTYQARLFEVLAEHNQARAEERERAAMICHRRVTEHRVGLVAELRDEIRDSGPRLCARPCGTCGGQKYVAVRASHQLWCGAARLQDCACGLAAPCPDCRHPETGESIGAVMKLEERKP